VPNFESFICHRYLRNPHTQTLLNSQGPRKLRARQTLRDLKSEHLILFAADGTRLLGEFDRAAGSSSGLVVLLHGWEGSSRSSYLVTTAGTLLQNGFDVLRLNLRDHGNSQHLNREIFNSTRTAEVASALQRFVDGHLYTNIFLVGFSLGGSFALRIAADNGLDLGLTGSIAVCPPTDPAHAMYALNNGFWIYERYFFKRWRRSLEYKLKCYPDLGFADDLARAKSVDDLNRLLIPRFTIYPTVEAYFAAYALVGDRLSKMAMPAYLIATEDDPIIPSDDLGRIDSCTHLKIEISPYGGHCGFIDNLAARSWVEGRILQIMRYILSPG